MNNSNILALVENEEQTKVIGMSLFYITLFLGITFYFGARFFQKIRHKSHMILSNRRKELSKLNLEAKKSI